MMKESRHLVQGGKYAPHPTDKPQPSSVKSNMGSLKAILSTFITTADQGRVPLAQYINEKTVKNDHPHSHLTYFEYFRHDPVSWRLCSIADNWGQYAREKERSPATLWKIRANWGLKELTGQQPLSSTNMPRTIASPCGYFLFQAESQARRSWFQDEVTLHVDECP